MLVGWSCNLGWRWEDKKKPGGQGMGGKPRYVDTVSWGQRHVMYLWLIRVFCLVDTRDAWNRANKGRTNPGKFGRNRNHKETFDFCIFVGKSGVFYGNPCFFLGFFSVFFKDFPPLSVFSWNQDKNHLDQGQTKPKPESFAEPRFGFAHPWLIHTRCVSVLNSSWLYMYFTAGILGRNAFFPYFLSSAKLFLDWDHTLWFEVTLT